MFVTRSPRRPLNDTPLMQAAFSTTTPVDAMMALAGVHDPLASDDQGRTALMLAAWQGGADKVRALLPVSDPNQQDDDGVTALMMAAGMGDPARVAALLPVSDLTLRDKWGMNPLMHAVRNAKVDNIPMLSLMFPTAQPDRDGNTLLSYALKAGPRTLQTALSLVPVDTPQEEGATVLMQAAKVPSRAAQVLLPLLLKAGANPDATDDRGRTALHHAVAHGPVATDLLMPVCDLAAQDHDGRTVLHHAAMGKSADALAIVLDAWPGTVVDMTDEQGRTALWQACATLKDPRPVMMLLLAGADVNTPDREGVTPLMVAMRTYGLAPAELDLTVVQTLLDAGANVNALTRTHQGLLDVFAPTSEKGLPPGVWEGLNLVQPLLPASVVMEWAGAKGLFNLDGLTGENLDERRAFLQTLTVRRETEALRQVLDEADVEVEPGTRPSAVSPLRPRL